MIWNIPSYTMTGTSHIADKKPGQDYIKVSLNPDNGTAIVVVTDGVGSARLAYEGSRGLAKEVAAQLERRGADLLGWSDGDIRLWLANVVADWLKAESARLMCVPEDLNTTLMIFLSDGDRFVAGSIGDGLVGRIGDDGFDVLLEPEHGAAVNVSYFVATSDFNSHFRIVRGRFDAASVYFAMTDGSCDCLYNYRARTYAEALGIFCEWTRKYDRKAVNKAVHDVASRLFKEVTSDDCAIALIHGREGSVR